MRVGLARARGQEDAIRVACAHPTSAVVSGHAPPRRLRAARGRIVASCVPAQRPGDRRKPHTRGIRVREVDDWPFRATLPLEQPMKRIGLEISRKARGQSFASDVAIFQIVFTAASKTAASSAGQKPLMLNAGMIHATRRRITAFTTK